MDGYGLTVLSQYPMANNPRMTTPTEKAMIDELRKVLYQVLWFCCDTHKRQYESCSIPASMLPTLARLLTMSLDELMGHAVAPAKRGTKRGPTSRLHQQIDAVEQLPKAKQQFVSQMLDTVLAQGAP